MSKPERIIVQIAPKTWLMSEYKLVNTYLLEGEDTAMLIDGGIGIGDLAADVKKLTDKPVIFVATHGDGDHIAAAGFYQRAYMNPLDLDRCRSFPIGREMAEFCIRTRGPIRNPETPVPVLMSLIPDAPLPPLPEFQPISDGYVFDLGGRNVEVIHTPGHSEGSCCLLDKNTRLLFCGDACNDRLLVGNPDRNEGLRQSLATFEKMWAREQEFDYICQGHDALDKSDKSFISDYIQAIGDLLAGAEGQPRTDAMHSGTMYPKGKVMVWYNMNMSRMRSGEN